MKIEDLYREVKEVVVSETGLQEEDVMSGKKEACVDARYILVYFLSQNLTDDEISRVMGYPRQSVNYMRNRFKNRIRKWSVKQFLSSIESELQRKGIEFSET